LIVLTGYLKHSVDTDFAIPTHSLLDFYVPLIGLVLACR
jgi:hypothetical protein